MKTQNFFLLCIAMLTLLSFNAKAGENYNNISLFINDINHLYVNALQSKLVLNKQMDHTSANILLKVDINGNLSIYKVEYEEPLKANEIKKILADIKLNKAPLEMGIYKIKVKFEVQ